MLITIDGGSIEGSVGVGLSIPWYVGGSCSLNLIRPIRITGGQSHPASVNGSVAAVLMRDAATQDALTGNAHDTLVILSHFALAGGTFRIRKELPWRLHPVCNTYNLHSTQLGQIIVEAGASLEIADDQCSFHVDLRAEGTAAEPAVIRGAGTRFHSRTGPDTARLRHVILENVRIRADSAPIIFENVRMTGSSLELFASGSRIDGVHSEGSASQERVFDPDAEAPAAVSLRDATSLQRAHIEAAGLDGIATIGTGITISDCTVSGNARHGIRVESGAPVISECNLLTNGGAAVSNAGAQPVDARLNWWGDAAGPLAPGGSGFEGDVQYVPFLTAPVNITCGDGCISPWRSTARRN